MKITKILLVLLILILFAPTVASAQSYSFEIPEATVDVFYNEDGTLTLNYEWIIRNRLGAAPVDFIDMGLPSGEFDLNSITAEVDGKPITDIQTSPYVQNGVALGLGANAIQPGQTGRVRAIVPVVRAPLFPDDSQDGYISTQFAPTWFDSKFVEGNTDLTVVLHLPPGVQNEEPRWHSAPAGFPDQPESALDAENRIVYIWKNPNASSSREYVFGASFPAQYVPGWEAASAPTTYEETDSGSTTIGVGSAIAGTVSACFSFLPGLICVGLVGLMIWAGANSGKRRKLQYLPPKVSIEGHGIKRGLTAIEAAILMEQPVDKIMTMILFSVIKKGAASVKTRDPLELDITVPAPEGLYDYEKEFLEAFSLTGKRERRGKLQDALINLINSVAEKIKGFSRKETIAYYDQIIETAWKQVEAADTPEVKSEKYEEVMDWTMLDKDYDDRTRRVFTGGPVFVPVWWPRYDPTFPRPTGGGTVSTGGPAPSGTGGGQISLPNLPGSDFAASVVNGVQTFAAGTLGNVAEFTGNVTNKTNPLPAPSPSSTKWRGSSGGGTHCVCACACACAGCACACAGGGR